MNTNTNNTAETHGVFTVHLQGLTGNWLAMYGSTVHFRGTHAEAVAYAVHETERMSTEREERETAREIANAEFEAFLAPCPNLRRRQCDWQDWRNRLYGEMCDIGKRAAAMRRAYTRGGASLDPRQDSRLAEAENEARAAEYHYYEICRIDRALKSTIRARDAAAWEAALQEAESVIAGN